MRHNFKQFFERASCKAQEGAALILFVMLIALGVTAYTLKVFSPDLIHILQDTNDSNILADAKAALLGYTLGRVGTGERPGDMPLPDYLSTSESPANYDGTSDGGCMDSSKSNGLPLINSGANMRCLGRLPWQTIGMSVPYPSQNDPTGKMPWYAVSANLVDPTCLSVLNPDVLNMAYSGYVCSGSTLPHPWLTVRDGRGNVLSNRVAIVLILPGGPVGSQSRPSSPLADVSNYLDSVTVPVGCDAPCVPGTYSNSNLANDFIMAAGLTGVGTNVTTNDRMIYITIDELMATLVKRAAAEARTLLKTYKTKNGQFPYAAPLGSTPHISSGTSTAGMVPIDVTDTCSCASASSCTCSFGLVNSIVFQRNSGTWNNKFGACSYSGGMCTCSGFGYCARGFTRSITCSSTGSCSAANAPGTYTFTSQSYADVYSASPGCTKVSASNAQCNASGSFTLGLNVAGWFKANNWQNFFYYQWSSAGDLQVGSHTNISALLIGTGNPIISAPYAIKGSAQNRPSPNINDYLDSAENTNGDKVYDGAGKAITSNYNDQMIIVAP